MTELLPCPFCGAKPEKVYKSSGQTTHIECPSCHAQFPKSTMENRYDEAWNMRAERTCHNTWDAELTGRLRFLCSECGGVSLEISPRFCPCCGARVVE